jgi:uncharacterized protein (UPF0276 family)
VAAFSLPWRLSVYATEPFSLEGLSTLNTSGSDQYDEMQLQNIITRVDPNHFVIHFVDLRQKSHVFIIVSRNWTGNCVPPSKIS